MQLEGTARIPLGTPPFRVATRSRRSKRLPLVRRGVMRMIPVVLGLVAGWALAAVAGVESLAALSDRDAVAGLKDALVQGASKAVSQLGASGGFLDNAKVKIPLPE